MVRWIASLFVVCATLAWAPAFAEGRIVMFAAASLKTALDAAAAKYHADGGAEIVISYGGSLTLARQMVAGAPVDLFGSADESSMDEAQKGGAIAADTRLDLLSNSLVLVAPTSASFDSLPQSQAALRDALANTRLATGDTSTVPVGKYAKAALTKLGLWDVVEPRLALTSDVRSALAFVARGEAGLGIVYRTDAAAEPKVKIVAEFPAGSHPPIRYPFALASGAHQLEAKRFFDFLVGPEAKPFFVAQGFGVDR